jgi:hypothetical protein
MYRRKQQMTVRPKVDTPDETHMHLEDGPSQSEKPGYIHKKRVARYIDDLTLPSSGSDHSP